MLFGFALRCLETFLLDPVADRGRIMPSHSNFGPFTLRCHNLGSGLAGISAAPRKEQSSK